MPEPVYLTRSEAASACGRHEDTIRRYERNGMPSRPGPGGRVVIAVADLVAAGLLDPLTAATEDLAGAVLRTKTERDLLDTRQALAVAEARIELLDRQVADLREDLSWTRSLVKKQAV